MGVMVAKELVMDRELYVVTQCLHFKNRSIYCSDWNLHY